MQHVLFDRETFRLHLHVDTSGENCKNAKGIKSKPADGEKVEREKDKKY